MTLTPILTAPLMVQIHLLCAVLAICLGPVNIWRKRRDRLHRMMGGTWMLAMFGLATSGLMMSSWAVIGPFNPIHLFSVLTYISLAESIWHLINRRFAQHGRAMRSLYFQGLAIAGLFTFLPGRTLNETFFAASPLAGFVATFVVVGGLAWLGWRYQPRVA
ncbi:DUF2306 domain-containing protein [Yoonia sp. R2331]|uniref:DUF2306 domain-containing protein n=1 Tax=Yoonia sp. R2331 TaxID=3237238 RepID=UPI0034E50593